MEIHNILPYAQISRQHGISGKKIYNTSKKLASGYKILQASDGSAALSISEKMRAQIRGLDQGVQNAQDAYSLCQTIDGKAQSCHALLQRIRELTLQAANGTNTDQDRRMIQQEVDQSIQELTQISNGLLDGSNIEVIKRCALDEDEIRKILGNYDFQDITQSLYDGNREIPKEPLNMVLAGLGVTQFLDDLIAKIDTAPNQTTLTTQEIAEKVFLNVNKLINSVKNVEKFGGDTIIWTDVEKILTDWEKDLTGTWKTASGQLANIKGTNVTGYFIGIARRMLAIIGTAKKKYSTAKARNDEIKGAASNCYPSSLADKLAENGHSKLQNTQLLADLSNKKYATVYRGIQFMLNGRNYDGLLKNPIRYEMYVQVGANAGHALKLTFSHLDFYGLYQVDVLSEEAGNRMLQTVDLYSRKVSDFIAEIGTYQNRLQHAMEYAMEHAEIETDAESRIRDADYGKEAVEHAKQNLQQQIQETLFTEKNRAKEQIKQILSRD